ncbi:MAG: AAA family ATPase [Egibacteraceae bacterium]
MSADADEQSLHARLRGGAPGFAGRQPEFADFLSVALPRALDGRYEQARLVTGARGMGKTALLRELEHEASTAGHWTVRVSATRGDAVLGDLVQTLAERVADKDSRARLTGALRSALERIGAVRMAGSGVELAAAERPLSDRGRARGLAQLLIVAGLLARQRGRAIVLLVDEAQNMDRPAVGDLFHALQEAQNHTLDVTHPAGATVRAWLPLVVWVAGLPGLLRHLRDSGSSFAERSKLVPLGLLRPPDVRAALERFAAAGEAVFEADGLDLLVDAVGGYPYFLHVVGSQTWTAGTGSVITADEVDRAAFGATADRGIPRRAPARAH